MSETFRLNVDFDHMVCKTCGTNYMITSSLHAARRSDKGVWFCPNGHQWWYTENEEDKLRRERDQLKQRLAQKDDDIRYWQQSSERKDKRLSAAKGQITKIKRRAANGVCPCCNRTFSDLARHMAGKHPGFLKEATADEQVTVN